MDKILITLFVTVLVGFLTATINIVRLVNDKEGKTTDYRQSWTNSLRQCLSSLISSVNTLASLTAARMYSGNELGQIIKEQHESGNDKDNDALEKVRSYYDKKILDEDVKIREIRKEMHSSYALTRLHFKPNDLSFSRIEQKFDFIQELFLKMSSLKNKDDDAERRILREKIFAASSEITAFSRDILKIEWESVKKGEAAYQRTKFWSVFGGGVALFVLFIFGVATAWTLLKQGDGKSEKPSNPENVKYIYLGDKYKVDEEFNVPNLIPKTSQIVNVNTFDTDCNKLNNNDNRLTNKPVAKKKVDLCVKN